MKLRKENNVSYGLCWEKHLDEEVWDLDRYYLRHIRSRDLKSPRGFLENLLVEGDNFPVMQFLLPIYKEKVQVIYIDPPYNTGKANQWVYNDHFKEKSHTWRHSKWLNFMEKRLRLAREFLSPEGVLFVSIDDNELAPLRLLLDEIFGEEHFVNTFLVRRATKNLNNQFKKVISLNQAFEYVLVYKKSDAFHYKNAFRETSDKRKSGYWTSFYSNADRPTMRYEIEGIHIDKGQWKWERNRAFRALENYKIYLEKYASLYDLKTYWQKFKDAYEEKTGYRLEFLRRKNNSIQYWVLPKEKTLMDTNLTDYYINDNYGKTRYGFDTVKNLKFIKKLISMVTSGDELIMDFFAGSGTTGHAVWELNTEDGGNRRFILITNNENGIAEKICYPRLKKVYDKFSQNNLYYFKLQNFDPSRQYSWDYVKKALVSYVQLSEALFLIEADRPGYTLLTDAGRKKNAMLVWGNNNKVAEKIQEMADAGKLYFVDEETLKLFSSTLKKGMQAALLPENLRQLYRLVKK